MAVHVIVFQYFVSFCLFYVTIMLFLLYYILLFILHFSTIVILGCCFDILDSIFSIRKSLNLVGYSCGFGSCFVVCSSLSYCRLSSTSVGRHGGRCSRRVPFTPFVPLDSVRVC